MSLYVTHDSFIFSDFNFVWIKSMLINSYEIHLTNAKFLLEIKILI